MEWKMKWNGTTILVWNMEDVGYETEWKISVTKWKIIFHISILIPYLVERADFL